MTACWSTNLGKTWSRFRRKTSEFGGSGSAKDAGREKRTFRSSPFSSAFCSKNGAVEAVTSLVQAFFLDEIWLFWSVLEPKNKLIGPYKMPFLSSKAPSGRAAGAARCLWVPEGPGGRSSALAPTGARLPERGWRGGSWRGNGGAGLVLGAGEHVVCSCQGYVLHLG